ncbi:class I SAM-dependent methyltransferase [Scopulibacillus cellulosilyticus]|uniref:Class I SAM-dependent methyltransferase n=1 Tax=Scopulibacillus cellulosilyticus TaxID=2665665 RepID=A0ABW2PZU3_9BACL
MELNKTHKIHLEKEKETLLITLLAKALDNQQKDPILNDKKAEELVNMIDYDFEKLNGFGNNIMVIRAKQLDIWLSEFVDSHQNTTVLNLGCGLDTRVSRINPQENSSWFDVDYPEVIEVRKFFYSNQNGYEMIPSSVTELDWLEKVPRNNPVMIIAEGLLEYLTEDEVKTLLNRITGYFSHGQIAFDVMNSFAINSGKESLKETTGAEHKWMVDDILEVDKLNPKLKRVASLSIFKSKYIHKLPLKNRLIYAAMCLFPSFRNMLRLLLYKF